MRRERDVADDCDERDCDERDENKLENDSSLFPRHTRVIRNLRVTICDVSL